MIRTHKINIPGRMTKINFAKINLLKIDLLKIVCYPFTYRFRSLVSFYQKIHVLSIDNASPVL